jgi:hypothetical protein
MVTFGINFATGHEMRDFIKNHETILENVGIANDHKREIGVTSPEIALKCKIALNLPLYKELSLTCHFGEESNCYWCTYAKYDRTAGAIWHYGVVFDVVDETKAVMLKLALS